MSKPLLSIGIIFKNEIRCLERCLKSLQPLRSAVPCEVVMADTGSNDGSRKVAEKYADILIDFAWINDFAAARNAVMDRCSGNWYFSIDADEWLDGDISELATFVLSGNSFDGAVANLMIRNYLTPELDENYSDFVVYRLFRLSTGLRYEGAIHERWPYEKSGSQVVHQLSRVMLHHDGYVNLYGLDGEAKRQRNLAALRAELKKEPENLRTLTQYLESAKTESDYLDELRRAMGLVRNKCLRWAAYGPSVFRYAVLAAKERGLPELKDWLQEAKERFPTSTFTKIDVEFIDFTQAWDEKDYQRCISTGERCLKAMRDLKEHRIGQDALIYGTVLMQGAHWEQELKTFLAEAYLREKHPPKCREYLEQVDYKFLNQPQTKRMVCTMLNLHTQSDEDTTSLVRTAWEGIQEPVPSKVRAEERKRTFLQEASVAFHCSQVEERHPAYTLFAPLAGECEIGNAAKIMGLEDVSMLEQALTHVKDWNELPIAALAHALECGVEFPLAEKPLNIEEMDGLAARLSQDKSSFFSLAGPVLSGLMFRWGPDLAWARAVALTIVQVYDWNVEEPNVTEGLSVARAFAQAEQKFLPCCYAPDALQDDGLYMLPPMHRFGWWCSKAFDALDAGDAVGYTRCLREGLNTCSTMKPMVEFLMEHTPELQAPPPSAELLALAAQIRTILSAYPADDPAVAALKQSEAYQKVAYLIEGLEPPVIGGQLQ